MSIFFFPFLVDYCTESKMVNRCTVSSAGFTNQWSLGHWKDATRFYLSILLLISIKSWGQINTKLSKTEGEASGKGKHLCVPRWAFLLGWIVKCILIVLVANKIHSRLCNPLNIVKYRSLVETYHIKCTQWIQKLVQCMKFSICTIANK